MRTYTCEYTLGRGRLHTACIRADTRTEARAQLERTFSHALLILRITEQGA